MSLGEIQKRIELACQKSGRHPSNVRLLAVSKRQSEEHIRQVSQQGQSDFGENYVQELIQKMAFFSKDSLHWHLIGHLQRNKVKMISGRCFRIHSVDSLRLAQELSRHAREKNIVEKVLLQINLAEEASKEGFSQESLATAWAEISQLPNLAIHGFMTMPPLQNEPEENRIYFRQLRILLDHFRQLTHSIIHPLNELSMGTSHDFEIAIEEGASWIRVGTLIFGERPPLPNH